MKICHAFVKWRNVILRLRNIAIVRRKNNIADKDTGDVEHSCAMKAIFNEAGYLCRSGPHIRFLFPLDLKLLLL